MSVAVDHIRRRINAATGEDSLATVVDSISDLLLNSPEIENMIKIKRAGLAGKLSGSLFYADP